MISFEHVVGYDLTLVAGHGSQLGAFSRGGIASGINRGVRDALQVFVDLDSPASGYALTDRKGQCWLNIISRSKSGRTACPKSKCGITASWCIPP